MYITAMWLRSPRTGSEGVNVVIYKHPGGLPHGGDLQEIIKNPGRKEEAIRYSELEPGGNRVQASLVLVLDDADYDRDRIDRVLQAIEAGRVNDYMSKPLVRFEEKLNGGVMKGLFQVNMGPLDAQSLKVVFSMLRGTMAMALEKRNDQLAA